MLVKRAEKCSFKNEYSIITQTIEITACCKCVGLCKKGE